MAERKKRMAKFRMILLDAYTRKQVKQKTFKAKDWDSAETIAHRMWREFDSSRDTITDMSLGMVMEKA